jgi:hypothetical protein
MSASGPELTALFARMRRGDADAVNGVMSALYMEVCEMLGEKLPTVRRDWVFARSWLKTKLQPVPRA